MNEGYQNNFARSFLCFLHETLSLYFASGPSVNTLKKQENKKQRLINVQAAINLIVIFIHVKQRKEKNVNTITK